MERVVEIVVHRIDVPNFLRFVRRLKKATAESSAKLALILLRAWPSVRLLGSVRIGDVGEVAAEVERKEVVCNLMTDAFYELKD